MRFSEAYELELITEEDWFDPILTLDTKLFIDPFLIYASEHGSFIGSHEQILEFFNAMLALVAKSGGDRGALSYRRAVDSMQFPEVEELCLGYTGKGTGGSGSGRGVAGLIAAGMWEAVEEGIERFERFEEVGIFGKRIGADRISDAVGRRPRRRLVGYTREVCARHGVPMKPSRYLRGEYDRESGRWEPLETELPVNPENGKPVLLVPRRYLRELPTVNADDFWDYCFVNDNAALRDAMSDDITRHAPKRELIQQAWKARGLRDSYLEHLPNRVAEPYDLIRDSQGLYNWYEATKEYCAANNLSLVIHDKESFLDAVRTMVVDFKHYVEQNGGWFLLWDDLKTRGRKEAAAQRLFLGVVKWQCRANDIDISAEVDLGRGSVDFKMSSGFALRVLLEVKLARNSKFWNGLEQQLPTYLKAEGVEDGCFVVVCYTEEDLEKVAGIQSRVRELNERLPFSVRTVVVDASKDPTSASKL